jgi:ABC-type amino acid transport substrate-binding protein
VEGLAAIEGDLAEAFASDRGILIGLAVTSKDPTRFFLANILFSYEPYGLVVRRDDGAFRLVVNRALAQLYRSGAVEPIYERWFGAFGRGVRRFTSCTFSTDCPNNGCVETSRR